MRGDVTGVGNPLDASQDPSADLRNLSALFGASQPVRRFSVCAVVPIFITLVGCDRISDTYPGFFYFLTILSFSLWILYIAGARETQEDTL